MKMLFSALMILLITCIGYTANAVSEELKRSDELQEKVQTMHQMRMVLAAQTELEERIREHEKQIECLAKNMYFEARGEQKDGQDAVAFVTINRVRSDRYPNTICEVVYQAKVDSRGRPLRNQCQFSWYCDGKVDTVYESIYSKLYKRAEFIYINYYLNDAMKDTTDGATHYHSDKVEPYWSKHTNYQLVASIGQHLFYQPTY